MRLTTRLSLFVGLGMLVVFAGHAAIRVQRDLRRYERDITSDHRVLARALTRATEEIAAVEGVDRARALLERVNEAEADVHVRWVDASGGRLGRSAIVPVRAHGADPVTERVHLGPSEHDDALVTHQRLRPIELASTAIELVEPLHAEGGYMREAIARTASTTAVALALCIAIITSFGAWFVGRPLRALRDHARRVAGGDLSVRSEMRTSDEIGELARDMNEMTAELERARSRVREEERARVEAMTQLRHVDRLRVVGEMASAVAHDLGTPMSTVRARAQMIEGGEIDPERARELATAIVAEVDRMSASIQRLLGHARRDARPRERERVPGSAFLREALDLVAPIAEQRGVLVVPDLDDAAELEIDRFEMRQAVVNVLVNALDASPRGARVDVILRAEARAWRIDVVDHGAGMPAEIASRAFDPFFTTKAEGRGTGLGLAIARGIVEEHGGNIEIESAPSEGTTVSIVLSR